MKIQDPTKLRFYKRPKKLRGAECVRVSVSSSVRIQFCKYGRLAFFQEFLSGSGAKPFVMKIFIVMLIFLSFSAKILGVENGLRGHCHAPMWKKPVGYNKL